MNYKQLTENERYRNDDKGAGFHRVAEESRRAAGMMDGFSRRFILACRPSLNAQPPMPPACR